MPTPADALKYICLHQSFYLGASSRGTLTSAGTCTSAGNSISTRVSGISASFAILPPPQFFLPLALPPPLPGSAQYDSCSPRLVSPLPTPIAELLRWGKIHWGILFGRSAYQQLP